MDQETKNLGLWISTLTHCKLPLSEKKGLQILQPFFNFSVFCALFCFMSVVLVRPIIYWSFFLSFCFLSSLLRRETKTTTTCWGSSVTTILSIVFKLIHVKKKTWGLTSGNFDRSGTQAANRKLYRILTRALVTLTFVPSCSVVQIS